MSAGRRGRGPEPHGCKRVKKKPFAPLPATGRARGAPRGTRHGRPGEETPPGEYTVGDKSENPAWSRIGKPIIPFGDPRNPLGTRWMGWFRDGFKTSYGFHGTSEPESVGQASSDGCIRLLRDDVERMFDILPIGARVIVRE